MYKIQQYLELKPKDKKYVGHSPKENPANRIQLRQAMQWNLHHPDDHGCFSHLLTSIN